MACSWSSRIACSLNAMVERSTGVLLRGRRIFGIVKMGGVYPSMSCLVEKQKFESIERLI